MGSANGIYVSDLDMSDTLDVSPRYADITYLFQDDSDGADSVAQSWLDTIDAYCDAPETVRSGY